MRVGVSAVSTQLVHLSPQTEAPDKVVCPLRNAELPAATSGNLRGRGHVKRSCQRLQCFIPHAATPDGYGHALGCMRRQAATCRQAAKPQLVPLVFPSVPQPRTLGLTQRALCTSD